MKVICIRGFEGCPCYGPAKATRIPIVNEVYTVCYSEQDGSILFYELSELEVNMMWDVEHFREISDTTFEQIEEEFNLQIPILK